MKYIGIWAALLLGPSAYLLPQASAQSLTVVGALPGAASVAAAPGPDFDGDGRADYFSLEAPRADGRRCLQVALSRGGGEWTRREAFCQTWQVSTLAAPERGDIAGRQRWVARLSTRLHIPQFGRLTHSRDAVLLDVDGRPGVLFFDDQRYVLHYDLEPQRVIHYEALDAFRRFEKG